MAVGLAHASKVRHLSRKLWPSLLSLAVVGMEGRSPTPSLYIMAKDSLYSDQGSCQKTERIRRGSSRIIHIVGIQNIYTRDLACRIST